MKIKIFLGVLIVVLLVGIINAQSLVVSFDKTTYGPDEKVLVVSVVTNKGEDPVEWVFEGELYSDNPESPIPRNFVKYLKLGPGEREVVNFEISTESIMFDGVYNVRVRLLNSADYKLVSKDSKSFNLADALKPLHVNVLFSEDKFLMKKSKTFLINQDIYLDYNANVEGVDVQAILTYPDKTTKKLTLPYSMKADKIGVHELKVTATKQGYPVVTKTSQFAVIEKEPVIKSASACNSNQVCDNNENHKTCSQDCKPNILIRYSQTSTVVLILLVLILIYLIKKDRKKSK